MHTVAGRAPVPAAAPPADAPAEATPKAEGDTPVALVESYLRLGSAGKLEEVRGLLEDGCESQPHLNVAPTHVLGARIAIDTLSVEQTGRDDKEATVAFKLSGKAQGPSELDTKFGKMPYTKTRDYPAHGVIDSTSDITGGFGFEGLRNLERFFVCPDGVLVLSDHADRPGKDDMRLGLVRLRADAFAVYVTEPSLRRGMPVSGGHAKPAGSRFQVLFHAGAVSVHPPQAVL